MESFIKNNRALLGLLVTCLVVYVAGITPSFSSDDYIHLINNSSTSISEAFKVFIEPFGREYRPMVRISLWFNQLMGETALPFKITNMILHLGCVILLYKLLYLLNLSRTANLIATCIFALHPIHTTSIHFILGRTDLVAAFFYLATLVSTAWWQNKAGAAGFWITFFLFIAALLSKELSVTLPILMTSVLFFQAKKIKQELIIKVIQRLWSFWLLTCLYLATRIIQWQQMPDMVGVYTNYSFLHIANNYAQWLFAMLYPFDLYIAQELMLTHSNLFFSLCSVIGAVFVIGIYLLWREHFFNLLKSPLLWLGIFWFFITLAPMSGGNPHRWYLYLPSAGFSIALAAMWESLSPSKKRKIFSGSLLALCVIYGWETSRQSNIWHIQHQKNELFLRQFTDLNLHHEKEIYFANIPFGYKSAFMFTHGALGEAVLHRFGSAPIIYPLSYLNITNNTHVAVEKHQDKITFTLKPNAFEFVLWNASLRRFNNPEVTDIYGMERSLEEVSENQKIARYSIRPSQGQKIYYFDGQKIQEFMPLN